MEFTGKWMELQTIIPSEVTRTPKRQTLHVFSPLWMLALTLFDSLDVCFI